MKRTLVIEELEAGLEGLYRLLGRLESGDGTYCDIDILKDVPLDDYTPKSPWPDKRGRKLDCVTTEDASRYIRSWSIPRLTSALDELKNGT